MNAERSIEIPASLQPLLKTIGCIAGELGMSAYAVGGCVRDWLLGLSDGMDLDVTVEGDGIALAKAAARALSASLTVHPQFGTATLALTPSGAARTSESFRVDVATCRRETYAKPGAYPKVTPGTIRDDLARRDFTINAMAVAIVPERVGVLVDPFGGEQDLRARRLRVLHPRSFLDDPSRILRGVRFIRRFGFHWERKTARLMQVAIAAGAFGWLNAGRIKKELERMRHEPDPQACLEELLTVLIAAR